MAFSERPAVQDGLHLYFNEFLIEETEHFPLIKPLVSLVIRLLLENSKESQ